MALSRKTVFSLGGPTYIEDPRVAEAQGWAALNQQRRGQDPAFSQALIGQQAEAAQGRARDMAREVAARERSQSAANKLAWDKQRADLDAELEVAKLAAGLEEARMREEGWSGREESRLAAERDWRQAQEEGLMRRALLADDRERGLAMERESGLQARDARRAEQEGIGQILKLAGLLPGPEKAPDLGDLLDLSDVMGETQKEIAEAGSPIELSARLAQLQQLGPHAYSMGAPMIKSRAEELSALHPTQGEEKWLPWLMDTSQSLGATLANLFTVNPAGMGAFAASSDQRRSANRDLVRALLGPEWADPTPPPPNPYAELTQIPTALPPSSSPREEILRQLLAELGLGE